MAKSIKYRKTKKVMKLKRVQEEILILLTDGSPENDFKEPLTVKQIAKRRNTTPQAVQKTIGQLKEHGVIIEDESTHRLNNRLILKQIKMGKPWRGHGYNFTIEILSKTNEYDNFIKNNTKDKVDGNTLELYENKIVFYGKKDFWGAEPDDVRFDLQEYLDLILNKIEAKRNIRLRKKDKIKIKEFRFHLAKVDDPDADYWVSQQKKQIKIYDKNGFLRMEMDNSFLPETEFSNVKHCFDDANNYKRHRAAELFRPDSLTVAELTDIIRLQAVENEKLSKNVVELSNNLKSTQEMLMANIQAQKNTEISLKTTIESQKLIIDNQREVFNRVVKNNDISEKELEDYGSYFI